MQMSWDAALDLSGFTVSLYGAEPSRPLLATMLVRENAGETTAEFAAVAIHAKRAGPATFVVPREHMEVLTWDLTTRVLSFAYRAGR